MPLLCVAVGYYIACTCCSSLHKEIMNIGGSKLKAVESRLSMVQAQIDQINGHVTKAKVSAKTATRSVEGHRSVPVYMFKIITDLYIELWFEVEVLL